MERQRTDDVAEFAIALHSYGRQTVIRRSRVRFRFAQEKRGNWLLLVKVFVRQSGDWRAGTEPRFTIAPYGTRPSIRILRAVTFPRLVNG
jgi:hypothetical protein